jgi:hypothetical protein
VSIWEASDNTVGGTEPGARNIISSNGHSGVRISSSGATGNTVRGNYIGTDASGTKDLGNLYGVVIGHAPNNTIGGTNATMRNIISGNEGSGIDIGGTGATGNLLQGNYIGTDATGTQDLGNSLDGVTIRSASKNMVGGTLTTARNLISGNDQSGVNIVDTWSTGNSILSNSIHSNGSLGIDLSQTWYPPDGVTANDEEDADTGPNNLQNYPVLDSATASGRRITIKGTLNSLPNRTYTLQFFSSPSDAGQGQKLIGQKVVTTDANGDASFTFTKRQRVPVGREITATATIHDATDTSKLLETSEFSAAKTVDRQAS